MLKHWASPPWAWSTRGRTSNAVCSFGLFQPRRLQIWMKRWQNIIILSLSLPFSFSFSLFFSLPLPLSLPPSSPQWTPHLLGPPGCCHHFAYSQHSESTVHSTHGNRHLASFWARIPWSWTCTGECVWVCMKIQKGYLQQILGGTAPSALSDTPVPIKQKAEPQRYPPTCLALRTRTAW